MENWERKMRERLSNELDDGYYGFRSGGGTPLVTNKAGWINYVIEVRKIEPELNPDFEMLLSGEQIMDFLNKTEQ